MKVTQTTFFTGQEHPHLYATEKKTQCCEADIDVRWFGDEGLDFCECCGKCVEGEELVEVVECIEI